MKRVAIVGAGPAGACAAHRLSSRGVSVTVFEAADAVGGRTRSFRDPSEGIVLDTGASFFVSFYDLAGDLIEALGIDAEVVELPRHALLWDGMRHGLLSSSKPLSLLGFPLLGFEGKVRVAWMALLHMLVRDEVDLANPDTLLRWDQENAEAWARRAVGEEAWHRLVRPAIEPFWYFPAERASAALPRTLLAHAATARFFGMRAGIDRLTEALLRGVEVRTNAPVQGIDHANNGLGLGVRWAGPEPGGAIFDAVVVATTATQALELTASLGDDLVPPVVRRFLTSVRYAANVHAVFRVDARALPPDLTAFFPCATTRSPVAAISTWRSRAPDSAWAARGQDLVSVYLSSERSAELLELPDAEVLRIAWMEATKALRFLPGAATPIGVWKRREATVIPELGHYRGASAAADAQRPPLVFAGDHLSTSTLEGALRSGVAAASLLLEGRVSR